MGTGSSLVLADLGTESMEQMRKKDNQKHPFKTWRRLCQKWAPYNVWCFPLWNSPCTLFGPRETWLSRCGKFIPNLQMRKWRPEENKSIRLAKTLILVFPATYGKAWTDQWPRRYCVQGHMGGHVWGHPLRTGPSAHILPDPPSSRSLSS